MKASCYMTQTVGGSKSRQAVKRNKLRVTEGLCVKRKRIVYIISYYHYATRVPTGRV